MRRWLLLATLTLVGRASPAQLPQAEAAFERGDHRAARAGYEAVLRQDSSNVRALYRLAVLDSWEGHLERSLARFVRLRRQEPHDLDIMVAHARVLAWAGDNRASERLHDSVLAREPRRRDALAGKARAVAWAGDLHRAEQLWREALAAHPDDPEILTGLAQTLFWQGRSDLAESYATRARQLAPGDRAARDVLGLVRAALRPELATASAYADDSDRNAFFAQDGWFTGSLGRDTRATLHGTWRRATDPARRGASFGADGHVITALGRGAVLRAGAGVRRLEPDGGVSRTLVTGQLGLGIRPAPFASLGLVYSRTAFDETAVLIERGYTLDGVDLSFDVASRGGVALSGGGGAAWLSEGNRRLSGVIALTTRVRRGLELGAFARLMGFREPNPGRGYFAPDRFSLLEARAAYDWRRERWGVRADGGVGVQQVGAGAPGQTEWHAGLALTRRWGANNELSLGGSYTNSAANRTGTASAAGFRYWTAGLRLRQGL
ncbi:MAG: tetratricopeptide repeat protein [Gemmatimonadales bacterium]|nr:tetratricopeptide repeat protein [Gemmatimonadales bacterium]